MATLRQTFKDIADAIRDKSGQSGGMTPAQMPQRIADIPQGQEKAVEKDVNFWNHFGDLLYSYTLEEAAQLTALPEVPAVDGLAPVGWNYSLQEVKTYGKPMTIGALYNTDDNATRYYVDMTYPGQEMRIYWKFNAGSGTRATLDWGDGSAAETYTGNSGTEFTKTHVYAQKGKYVIRLLVTNNTFLGNMSSTTAGNTLCGPYVSDKTSPDCHLRFTTAITGLEVGKYASPLRQFSLRDTPNIRFLMISDNAYRISPYSILRNGCGRNIPAFILSRNNALELGNSLLGASADLHTAIKVISIGSGIIRTQTGCLQFNSIPRIDLPNTLSSMSTSFMAYNYGITEQWLPDDVQSTGDKSLYECTALQTVHFGRSLSRIAATSAANATMSQTASLRLLDFSRTQQVPVLAASNGFVNITNTADASNIKIVVPDSLAAQWRSATNWNEYASLGMISSVTEATQGGII